MRGSPESGGDGHAVVEEEGSVDGGNGGMSSCVVLDEVWEGMVVAQPGRGAAC